jgi:glyoxylase-like metal-dependent hydrolase (beta-lactamase superfamily II)
MDVECVTAEAAGFTANAWLVQGSETTLVDVGAMEDVAEVVATRIDHLDSVVITHQHGDHVAQLEEIVEAFDPAVFAFQPIRPDTVSVADGETVAIGGELFEAVHTPGHAEDHLAFAGESALFSGDVVVYNDAAFEDGSFGRTDMAGQDRETLVESLRELLDRLPKGVDSMYAGHGDPYHGDVRAVIERALKRAERYEPKYPDE